MVEMYRGLEDMGVDTSDDRYRHSVVHEAPSRQQMPCGMEQGAHGIRSALLPASEWSHGPDDPAGRMARPSERPLLCMAVFGDLAVVGSADHGLWEMDLRGSLRVRRSLYTKTCGHTEWVTCVAHLPDGRVLSGGMDSKLCLWNAAGKAQCRDLVGHTGSVSQLHVATDGSLAVSASYDKTLRVWSLHSGAEAATLRAHRAPVLQLAWGQGVLASGDRDGQVLVWSLQSGVPIMQGAHQGHVTALAIERGGAASALLSGGQDGVVKLWDVRAAQGGAQARAHVGAVNELLSHQLPSGQSLVLSAGADRAVLALEPRMSLRAVHRFTEQRDHVYSLAAIGGLVLSGGGDGLVLVHDLETGALRYGLGANQAAVRCLWADAHLMVAAGDDG